MEMNHLYLKHIIQVTPPLKNAPDISIDRLNERLQPFFPAYNVYDLLDRFGLITKEGAIAPFLIHQGLVKFNERFPESNALVLDVTVTEPAVHVIRAILQAHLDGDENDN